MSTRKRINPGSAYPKLAPANKAFTTPGPQADGLGAQPSQPATDLPTAAPAGIRHSADDERRGGKRTRRRHELPHYLIWWAAADGEPRATSLPYQPPRVLTH